MENNIINNGDNIIIINGGNPLKDCPTNWDDVKKWEDEANKNIEGDFEGPLWKFDCGFKLDYDGPLLRISSRFYPPKTHYGETWDGTVDLYIIDELIFSKEFDCETLEDLKQQVEKYIKDILIEKVKKIKDILKE